MKIFSAFSALAILTLACATLEGLVELSPQFIQFNGALIIICTAVIIGWILKLQANIFSKD
jgi:hypothetical protein